jgi:hypothetical protein
MKKETLQNIQERRTTNFLWETSCIFYVEIYLKTSVRVRVLSLHGYVG